MAGRPTLRRAAWLASFGLLAAAFLLAARQRRRAPGPLPPPPPDRATVPAPLASAAAASLVAPPLPSILEEDTEENTLPLSLAIPTLAARAHRHRASVLAFAAVAAALGAYHALASRLPDAGTWADVAIVSLLVIPATFALVRLALPWRTSRALPWAALGLASLAALLELAALGIAASFVKLAALTALGWFFLRFFEQASWVVLVALLIVPVDIYSVASGPTSVILEREPGIFDRLSVAFPVPGEDTLARLGLPDVLFFALFLGAADRFELRRNLTWAACTLSFGLTLALTVGFDSSGFPALPLLAAGFVLPNADLLWRRLRSRRA
ncbi:MAG: hypothetical protein IT201_13175 [Thermoleophilia bacterium]|nr:hypothetical protein [Thermoleophilia bacterium]